MGLNNEHVAALAKRGEAGWNAWAQKLIDAKNALIAAGTWCPNDHSAYEISGNNEPTRAWLEEASVNAGNWDLINVDFMGCIFPGPVNLQGAKLKGAKFGTAQFLGLCRFDGSVLSSCSFNAATFHDTAFFDGCIAGEQVDFSTVAFKKDVWFQNAALTDANFWRCECDGPVYFEGTSFTRYVNLEWCEFRGNVSFEAAQFQDAKFLTTSFESASFKRASLSGSVNLRNVSARDLDFEGASFDGSIDLRNLRVTRACSFRSLRSSGQVDLEGASFGNPPDFTLSTFRRDPRLDTIRVRRTWLGFYTRPPTGVDATERKPPWFGVWIDEHAPAKFRELKKIAAGSNDAIKELEFHAQEIRSSRFVTDWPVLWRGKQLHGILRFWCGLLYGALSDFGQSVMRPFLWWAAILALCALLYLGQSPAMEAKRQALQEEHWRIVALVLTAADAFRGSEPCVPGLPRTLTGQTNAFMEAIQISAMNAVVFADSGADQSRRAYGCLFGLENPRIVNSAAIVPPWVSWISRFQRAISAILLFLFGLGLRNMLKIK